MLEVTEEALAEDSEAADEFILALKVLGVRLALDDFGTGYSSLSRLQRLPLDVIKIDRSFGAGLGTDATSEAIVRAVAALANDLGLRVVAEGIETQEQVRMAQALGCHLGQGFYFAWPLSGEAVADLLLEQAGALEKSAAA
jgi:EAL domain-containing protein (putative c-di-GMP-specific phosphodiesterase class I)